VIRQCARGVNLPLARGEPGAKGDEFGPDFHIHLCFLYFLNLATKHLNNPTNHRILCDPN
jgi:hypothetical protein